MEKMAVKHTRLTAAGNIKGTEGKLHWLIASNPDSGVRHFTLHNATDGTDNEVHKFYVPGQSTQVYSFDPPIAMGVGIRIGDIEDSDTVVTGGYE